MGDIKKNITADFTGHIFHHDQIEFRILQVWTYFLMAIKFYVCLKCLFKLSNAIDIPSEFSRELEFSAVLKL